MKNLKILVPLHTLPDVKSVTTIFFESLLSVLKTKVNVHILWLVYTPERIDSTNWNHSDSTVLDIHDYENAVDVIKKENLIWFMLMQHGVLLIMLYHLPPSFVVFLHFV